MRFAKRRFRNTVLLVLAVVIANLIFEIIDLSLYVQQFYSGWLMSIILLFLLSFYIKKKLSILSLGSNSTWSQWHYNCGYFVLAVFFMHIEFDVPDGNVEITLSVLLLMVTFVGIAGLIINRVFARRLAYLGQEVVFEKIAGQRMALKKHVEEGLFESVKKSQSSTLADYYLTHLSQYFSGHCNNLAHIFGNNFAYTRMVNNLQQQMRYLNENESEFAIELEHYIKQKNILDKNFALQRVLKYWQVLHAPLGAALALFTILHIVLVYVFRGSV